MAVTIVEVAQLAGVSPATVSRAFSRPDLLRDDTREAVLRAADKLGYSPNRAAQGLVTGRTGNIGVLVPDIVNPFYPPVIKGATDAAAMTDLSVFLATTDSDPRRELRMAREMAKQVDGLVLCATQLPDDDLALLAGHCPLVLVNSERPGLTSVVIDTEPGMTRAVDHLADLGHPGFVYLSGPETSWSNSRRLAVLRAHAVERGLAMTVLGPFDPSYASGLAAADLVIGSGATAVVAFDDQMALGVLTGLADQQVDVPGEISVIGCDDVLPVGMARPSLTTVNAPCARLGRRAVALIPRAGQAERHAYDGTLVVRGSTGRAAS
ncbi:LacI family DNA-binding transcriptional regulator [Pseudonocardia sp. HH130630-07]|uniref:LacI family DNA-binding transcriptional regulator n=1 Tax=Pseudonocardia sp. HH130630-07 TaxID=1690815 RepID=UPI000814D104|nr:LacI family DNA-binding transcriptional regulator [Pseudonocardia sp. HH130630-07]ANY07119.1 hypothetical protein AFB00_13415 [Pseudonocardia sp. HH130630-07]